MNVSRSTAWRPTGGSGLQVVFRGGGILVLFASELEDMRHALMRALLESEI